jgi:hypothetical protein
MPQMTYIENTVNAVDNDTTRVYHISLLLYLEHSPE